MSSFRRLIPPGGDCTAVEALAGWREEPERDEHRPRVALNMIASVDGRVTLDGRSGPLGGAADRELFHALRAEADAVLAGAGTVRIERYGPIVRDEAVRERRLAAGLEAQPLAVIVTRSLDLDPQLPLLADPQSRVVIVGPSKGSLSGARASIEYVRSTSLAAALGELRARFGLRLVVCEGGPMLAGALAREDVLDELFVACSPKLVGGPAGPTLLAGEGPPLSRELRLALLLAHGDELYSRYVVV